MNGARWGGDKGAAKARRYKARALASPHVVPQGFAPPAGGVDWRLAPAPRML